MTRDQIARVRSFSRIVTERVGALNDRFLGRDRPLGEARLLFEIGSEGAEVRELRARLALDSGYLSRLLRSLGSQGLVEMRTATADARVRRARLTDAGLAEVEELDRRSDESASSILAPLSGPQQDRLVAAMSEVERLLNASAAAIDIEVPTSPDATWCLHHYFRELGQRFERGFDPTRSISVDAEELTPPAGVFLVAHVRGGPIGCGALKTGSRGVGEIKRMWVAGSARGLGIGRRILETLEGYAEAFGLTVLRLETNRTLKEAQSLYRKCGYREVEPFNDEPYADHWFEKRLGPP